ncbi:MAG: SprT family zinc-dependent metalloprotease [Candidatus Neomarinimicrobiota bacterium]|jgi:hypothetical protein|nr:SprT family zinc-dependent metalloprotease [Candidatus Neomarinimicrobiota bacterium]MDD3715660.1 SprT family zinc-dependent metalloprotease [Candidatus Neomarinimicrobiota bacterium]MDD3966265.1 SprT family zinc-dependent metalloprotease [Candidatus Neomarinimicrobiota bacterium]MDD4961855.1 SprT family zinc-dependent metalloprotease [Candidatus Neomarinimicrobiota bacterium]MDX9781156.1 SprT family zinc-dependent metalloprotease [bacterium]
MTSEQQIFSYGKNIIPYRLFYSSRKTLEISVFPDGSVTVKAPVNADLAAIDMKLRKRARWIVGQRAYFEQFNPRTTPRLFLSGETHLYLGKRFQLKIVPGSQNRVRLINGRFFVESPDTSQRHIRTLMDTWYKEKARHQFHLRFDACRNATISADHPKPRLQIKRLKKRWGSLSPGGILTLNLELIKAPKECIDYVITHELCHLKYPHHDPDFYRLLEERIPDWEKIKHKLEVLMS